MILKTLGSIPDIAGRTEGSLTVGSFSHRDASGLKFNIRCNRCGDTWLESYRRIMDGFLRQGCHNTQCRLNRLPERKVSKHEQWLNSTDEPAPEPLAPEPVKAESTPELVSVDYLRYLTACQKIGQHQVISPGEFNGLGSFMHKNLMERVEKIEEREK
jgi:hypothetical protein